MEGVCAYNNAIISHNKFCESDFIGCTMSLCLSMIKALYKLLSMNNLWAFSSILLFIFFSKSFIISI